MVFQDPDGTLNPSPRRVGAPDGPGRCAAFGIARGRIKRFDGTRARAAGPGAVCNASRSLRSAPAPACPAARSSASRSPAPSPAVPHVLVAGCAGVGARRLRAGRGDRICCCDIQRRDGGTTLVFISHDLVPSCGYLADEVVVMYLGRGDGVRRPRGGAVRAAAVIRIRRALLAAVPVRSRDRAAGASGWRGKSPARSTHRPGAALPAGVRVRWGRSAIRCARRPAKPPMGT